jgi:hypothetical protein
MGAVESGRAGDPGVRKQPALASTRGAATIAHLDQETAERRFMMASAILNAIGSRGPTICAARGARGGRLFSNR